MDGLPIFYIHLWHNEESMSEINPYLHCHPEDNSDCWVSMQIRQVICVQRLRFFDNCHNDWAMDWLIYCF